MRLRHNATVWQEIRLDISYRSIVQGFNRLIKVNRRKSGIWKRERSRSNSRRRMDIHHRCVFRCWYKVNVRETGIMKSDCIKVIRVVRQMVNSNSRIRHGSEWNVIRSVPIWWVVDVEVKFSILNERVRRLRRRRRYMSGWGHRRRCKRRRRRQSGRLVGGKKQEIYDYSRQELSYN